MTRGSLTRLLALTVAFNGPLGCEKSRKGPESAAAVAARSAPSARAATESPSSTATSAPASPSAPQPASRRYWKRVPPSYEWDWRAIVLDERKLTILARDGVRVLSIADLQTTERRTTF